MMIRRVRRGRSGAKNPTYRHTVGEGFIDGYSRVRLLVAWRQLRYWPVSP